MTFGTFVLLTFVQHNKFWMCSSASCCSELSSCLCCSDSTCNSKPGKPRTYGLKGSLHPRSQLVCLELQRVETWLIEEPVGRGTAGLLFLVCAVSVFLVLGFGFGLGFCRFCLTCEPKASPAHSGKCRQKHTTDYALFTKQVCLCVFARLGNRTLLRLKFQLFQHLTGLRRLQI